MKRNQQSFWKQVQKSDFLSSKIPEELISEKKVNNSKVNWIEKKIEDIRMDDD